MAPTAAPGAHSVNWKGSTRISNGAVSTWEYMRSPSAVSSGANSYIPIASPQRTTRSGPTRFATVLSSGQGADIVGQDHPPARPFRHEWDKWYVHPHILKPDMSKHLDRLQRVAAISGEFASSEKLDSKLMSDQTVDSV